jgi:hypothetical protein
MEPFQDEGTWIFLRREAVAGVVRESDLCVPRRHRLVWRCDADRVCGDRNSVAFAIVDEEFHFVEIYNMKKNTCQ